MNRAIEQCVRRHADDLNSFPPRVKDYRLAERRRVAEQLRRELAIDDRRSPRAASVASTDVSTRDRREPQRAQIVRPDGPDERLHGDRRGFAPNRRRRVEVIARDPPCVGH